MIVFFLFTIQLQHSNILKLIKINQIKFNFVFVLQYNSKISTTNLRVKQKTYFKHKGVAFNYLVESKRKLTNYVLIICDNNLKITNKFILFKKMSPCNIIKSNYSIKFKRDAFFV